MLQDRVSELTEVNLDIIEYIEKTEKKANDIVDGILRKYERYQDVMTTVEKKHGEEIDSHKSQLNFIKKESKMELPSIYMKSKNDPVALGFLYFIFYFDRVHEGFGQY